jgi:type I restriction enzyme, S subunit
MPATNLPPNMDAHVPTSEERHQQFAEFGWWVTPASTSVPAHWLLDGDQRLDAGYYSHDVATAWRVIRDCRVEVRDLSQVAAGIDYPGRFKRVYAPTQTDGTPFLTASEMIQFRPFTNEFLASSSGAAAICAVQPGWMLVTRSGTVGRCVIVGNRLSKFAITDDAIRVQVGSVPIGYLYAYLSTWLGQTLIAKDQYGSAIKHLEPHQLATIPVPLLPEVVQQTVHDEIWRAYGLRDEANDLLDEADDLLHQELGLPRLDETLVPYLTPPPPSGGVRPEMPHPKAFTVRASELHERLDPSYHVPVVRTATELLRKGKYPCLRLSELMASVRIPPRFKRIYVQKEHGVPFLRPSQLPLLRRYDLGHISRLTDVLDALTLHKGEVLITTDGTIGRISMVTSRIAGWAGSNNIARVTCSSQDLGNGFLAAFLSTRYGFVQLAREIYGGVVDHIEESHIKAVLVPAPPKELEAVIGELVVRAFEKKDEAIEIEDTAIARVAAALHNPPPG